MSLFYHCCFIRHLQKYFVLIVFILLQGCGIVSTVTQDDKVTQDDEPAMNTLEKLGAAPDTVYAVDVYDPWEGINRKIYNFNAQLDDYLLLPVIRSYQAYIPRFLRQGINNFYNNLTSINHTLNAALQLKGRTTFNNGLRFISNSTMGLAGVFDVATGMGFPEIQEDFGQVLGHWGVKNGPYLVLPFFGPSNLRDTTGLGVDFIVAGVYQDALGINEGSEKWVYLYYGLLGVDTRANIDFQYYDSITPFEYEFIRMMYTTQRRILIGE
jgi:phospholipid-binding lipoprotein MlaA